MERGRRRRGRGRNTSASADSARSFPAAPARNSPVTPSVVPPVTDPPLSGNDDGGAENSDDDQTERPRKRNRNRNMNIKERLVLIRECCEHADEYRPGNKTKFWAIIPEFSRQQAGYELVIPHKKITRWVKARIDELVQEEMGSGTEVERDDF